MLSVVRALEHWFATVQRDLPWRHGYDPYHVWVSEVMLQQTRMEVVVPYFLRFVQRFPTVAALAAADIDEVTALWSGLGYYRRARMLHAGAREVVQKFDGTLPRGLEQLRSIPGVGRYTAGAIASIGYEQREPLVDGNVTRVLARIFAFEEPIGTSLLERRLWSAAAALVAESASPRALNQSLMELGAVICTPRNPACDRCPVSRVCRARSTGRQAELPHPKERAATRELLIPLLIVENDAGEVLVERARGTLMDALFHLPQASAELVVDSSQRFEIGERLGSFRHTITTRRITFELRAARPLGVSEVSGDAAFVSLSTLESLPHASYVKKALRLLRRG